MNYEETHAELRSMMQGTAADMQGCEQRMMSDGGMLISRLGRVLAKNDASLLTASALRLVADPLAERVLVMNSRGIAEIHASDIPRSEVDTNRGSAEWPEMWRFIRQAFLGQFEELTAVVRELVDEETSSLALAELVAKNPNRVVAQANLASAAALICGSMSSSCKKFRAIESVTLLAASWLRGSERHAAHRIVISLINVVHATMAVVSLRCSQVLLEIQEFLALTGNDAPSKKEIDGFKAHLKEQEEQQREQMQTIQTKVPSDSSLMQTSLDQVTRGQSVVGVHPRPAGFNSRDSLHSAVRVMLDRTGKVVAKIKIKAIDARKKMAEGLKRIRLELAKLAHSLSDNRGKSERHSWWHNMQHGSHSNHIDNANEPQHVILHQLFIHQAQTFVFAIHSLLDAFEDAETTARASPFDHSEQEINRFELVIAGIQRGSLVLRAALPSFDPSMRTTSGSSMTVRNSRYSVGGAGYDPMSGPAPKLKYAGMMAGSSYSNESKLGKEDDIYPVGNAYDPVDGGPRRTLVNDSTEDLEKPPTPLCKIDATLSSSDTLGRDRSKDKGKSKSSSHDDSSSLATPDAIFSRDGTLHYEPTSIGSKSNKSDE